MLVVSADSVTTGPAVGDEPVIAGGPVVVVVSVAEVACVLSSKIVVHEWLEPDEKKAPLVAVCGLVRVVGFEV
jgi:hypothetical protein